MNAAHFTCEESGMDPLDNAFLTRAEVAMVLRCSEGKIRKWIDAGVIAAATLPDGTVRISRDEVLRILTPRAPTPVLPIRHLGGARC